jgi:hypothetical protein
VNPERIVKALLEETDGFHDPEDINDFMRDHRTINAHIPEPDNPAHVDNLKNFRILKALGFKGPDASLRTSLDDYGFAWLSLPHGIPVNKQPEPLYLFVYRRSGRTFDRATIPANVNVFREYDWIDWQEFLGPLGMEPDDFNAMPLPMRIYEIFTHYGAESTFGSSYWEGFKITALVEEEPPDEE